MSSPSGRLLTDLVVARTHECIVPQVTTDISGDDLSVDTISRNEVLVRSVVGGGRGRGGRRRCTPALTLAVPLALSLALSLVSIGIASRRRHCGGSERGNEYFGGEERGKQRVSKSQREEEEEGRWRRRGVRSSTRQPDVG